ncbi:unnamed protein product, partial [Pylaiella littoralis]
GRLRRDWDLYCVLCNDRFSAAISSYVYILHHHQQQTKKSITRPRQDTMPRGKNNRGRWTKEEHDRFLIGLANVGEEWSLVANYVTTRSVLQIRTHAQKYLRKMKQGLPFPEEPYKSTQDG